MELAILEESNWGETMVYQSMFLLFIATFVEVGGGQLIAAWHVRW
jgi:hypothetical protein